MTRYEMAEIIYNALSKGAKAEKKLVEEFKPELQAMAAQKKKGLSHGDKPFFLLLVFFFILAYNNVNYWHIMFL